MKTRCIIAAASLLAGSASSWAIGVAGSEAPSGDSVRAVVLSPAAAAAQADDSSSMREGVINAVSEKHDQVEINGSWLKVVAGKTQLFRNGRSASPDQLKTGQKVRFTLAPGMPDRATLGAVYVP